MLCVEVCCLAPVNPEVYSEKHQCKLQRKSCAGMGAPAQLVRVIVENLDRRKLKKSQIK